MIERKENYSFVNWLKVIAAILITNSHFSSIWPNPQLATGGMLGNVLFMAVTGFLLFGANKKFPTWFGKRFLRVYPALLIFTLTAILFGKYQVGGFNDVVRLFVYPTNYVFIVWILICYAVFYLVDFINKKFKHGLEACFVITILLWLTTYVVFVDKTVYSVDHAYEPFILFLYFLSMMLGALVKKYSTYLCKFRWYLIPVTIVLLAVYFASKVFFSRTENFLFLQILNQFSILLVLLSVLILFLSLEKTFLRFNKGVTVTVKFLANLTLQIYVVQFLIIDALDSLSFPINLIATSVAILVASIGLYYVEYFIKKGVGAIIRKLKKDKNNAESCN